MPETSGVMRGKRGLIMGLANNRSIAWGIAKACHAHGAELAFTYQGDALRKRVEPLATEVGGLVAGHCDVTDPATVDAVFREVERLWGGLDFLVHAIAFSDLIYVRDIRMIQCGGGGCLLFEASHPIFVSREIWWKNFQGDVAMEPRVFSQINFAHAALADFRADFITT